MYSCLDVILVGCLLHAKNLNKKFNFLLLLSFYIVFIFNVVHIIVLISLATSKQ